MALSLRKSPTLDSGRKVKVQKAHCEKGIGEKKRKNASEEGMERRWDAE